MVLEQSLPSIGQAIVLEAEPGNTRTEIAQQWLHTAQLNGATTWLLSCDAEERGLWAGLNDWLHQLVPQIQKTAPHLIEKHSYELAMVLPALRRHIAVQNPNLTDIAENDERVRNYPLDRAYRIVHGLIDLLDAWYPYTNGSPWVIACDRYEQGGFLVRRFFAELLRRRGQRLKLTVLFMIDPEHSSQVLNMLKPQYLAQTVRLDLPRQAQVLVDPQQMTQQAQELEQQIGRDLLEAEIHGPKLINCWLRSDQPENALIWQARLLGIYTHQGFYEDSLVYCEAIVPQLQRLCGNDNDLRWNTVGNLFSCYATCGNAARAYEIVEQEALLKIETSRQLVRVYYLMAMLHARFLPQKDLTKAEDFLKRSLALLAETEMPEDELHFITAFDYNGLAFIRHRQGRATEAIELCQIGIERLNTHLRLDRHQLHRSVLHYNIAQVYAAIGAFDDAVTYFTAAITADQNYSEYYNERGNVYQKMGRLEEAVNDYQKAIELSPPYYEVWMNLGRCYHLQGQITQAAEAYSMALDLDPNQMPALIGRAEAWESLGEFEQALVDYSAALAIHPNQPLLLANRATLHYELDHFTEALEDLNQAIDQSPNNPEFHQNRSIVLMSLGQLDAAARDLQTYLRLCPDALDRAEVEDNLLSLSQRSTD
jgi:tetratricopeptide (TPR) repeat protein